MPVYSSNQTSITAIFIIFIFWRNDLVGIALRFYSGLSYIGFFGEGTLLCVASPSLAYCGDMDENYRIILGFLEENKDMIDDFEDNLQEVVKVADLELQRMFWDISSLEEVELSEAEEEFIKSIIESPEVLKVSVPKYFVFYRKMTSLNYKACRKKKSAKNPG